MKEAQRVLMMTSDVLYQGDALYRYQEELRALIEADGGDVVVEAEQRNLRPNPRFFYGSGKVQELKDPIHNHEIDVVVLGDEVSGAQLRNLEREWDVQVIDRTHLILDIFAMRAQTREATLQVHLAQLIYGKSRLIGSYSLSRTGGGIGTRGPGEQKLELDRRHLDEEITRTRRQIREVKKARATTRQNRQKSSIPRVSLLGYTNAGKSTLMNRFLSDEGREEGQVFVKDQVFATLDTTLRRVNIGEGFPIILSDTVGFVADLPTLLVDSFHATLEEMEDSALILHVLDATSPDLERERQTTLQLLQELHLEQIPRIVVLNKMDLREEMPFFSEEVPVCAISARTGEGMEALREAILTALDDREVCDLFFSFQEQGLVSAALEEDPHAQIRYEEDGTHLHGRFSKAFLGRLRGRNA